MLFCFLLAMFGALGLQALWSQIGGLVSARVEDAMLSLNLLTKILDPGKKEKFLLQLWFVVFSACTRTEALYVTNWKYFPPVMTT